MDSSEAHFVESLAFFYSISVLGIGFTIAFESQLDIKLSYYFEY